MTNHGRDYGLYVTKYGRCSLLGTANDGQCTMFINSVNWNDSVRSTVGKLETKHVYAAGRDGLHYAI